MSDIFGPLSDAFFWLLQFLHTNLGISWSWSIVLLTVIVRIILIPLTWRQLKSMRAMQRLQPQIKELQEKYKNDRQLLNQKTMEFYQENKVSPFGSCLPLVLQLPVFFGLYYMLREAGQAGGVFAPPNPVVSWLWISDITKFDYVLMFLYIASQFVASWQTARNSPGQQKMIAYFMPIMVGIFMFIGKWPAGLFIYWITSNFWTIAQQFVAEKLMPMPAVAVATGGGSARPTAARVTSSKPSDGKPTSSRPGATSSRPGAVKGTPGKNTPGKSATGKNLPAKGTSGTNAAATNPPGKTTPGKSNPAKTTPANASSANKPAGKSGGKSSVQQSGKQTKATTGEGQRPDGGAGGPEGSG